MLRHSHKSAIKSFYRGITILALAIATGCSTPTETGVESERKDANSGTGNLPVVAATTSVICDLTKQIAESTIDIKCLLPGGTDPHVYQPTSGDRKSIETAKLILYAGYDLDPSLAKLAKSSSNPAPKVAVHEIAVPQPLYGESHHHEGEEEHQEEETEEKTPDPHIWHDPKNGVRMVETIRDKLKQISPTNTNLYDRNAQKITAELQEIDTWIKSQIQTIPVRQRKLITTHDALGYYAKAYGLNIQGALSGLSTEQQPSAAKVGQLVKEIKSSRVPTIFIESTVNPRLMEIVSKEANVKLANRELFADGLGEAGSDGSTYQKMLVSNTQTIVEGLGGKYLSFTKQQ